MHRKIFTKRLNKIDVEHRLSILIGPLTFFPCFKDNHKVQVLKIDDEEGNAWPFQMIISKGSCGKIVMSGAWLQFVRSKQLQSGFKVQLFMEEDVVTRDVKYKVKLKKPHTIF
ncbi:hypothetical protein Pint_34051 [Pistacia integerrima]|uniref:Uncharacterized protein n=2 Tax=Pistacia integerrima TaxID=434235 RepID=A0ACC0X608_9ROSI|nr:hypothetical protein Pint_34063 [Pistacia integerrima]KAJ0010281.1 hypothetical protein Pint_34051 [Pistacia integerrima]